MTDAAVETLAGDTPMPEISEDEALGAVFDKAQAEPEIEPDEPEVVLEEPEAEEAEAVEDVEEPEAEDDPAPGVLPADVRAVWADIPKAARESLVRSHNEMSAKLADQGRLVTGLKPIQSAMVQAVQDNPNLANMRPEQVATELMELAKVSRQFSEKPVETLIGLAQKHNMTEALKAALTGQQPAPEARQAEALQNEIKALKSQLQRLGDPEYLRSQVSAITSETRVMDEVTTFAQTAEHWGQVEEYLPLVIPAIKAKLGDGASAKDVLEAAYNTTLDIYLPDLKAKPTPSRADAVPDPKKAEAALKAKSVNVAGTPTGKPRKMSEDETLAAAWDRARAK